VAVAGLVYTGEDRVHDAKGRFTLDASARDTISGAPARWVRQEHRA
jgi:hypothetical protein